MKRYRSRKINGRTLLEHRIVVERAIGRPLRTDEHVHHKNGDRFDNRIENLEILSPADHMRLHKQKHPRIKTCSVCGVRYEPKATKRASSKTCGDPKCYFSLIGKAHRKIPADQIPRIIAMRAEGKTLASIAEIFGVTKQNIALICKNPPAFARAIVKANVVDQGVLDDLAVAVGGVA